MKGIIDDSKGEISASTIKFVGPEGGVEKNYKDGGEKGDAKRLGGTGQISHGNLKEGERPEKKKVQEAVQIRCC